MCSSHELQRVRLSSWHKVRCNPLLHHFFQPELSRKNFRKNALSELGNLNRSAWNCFLHVGNHRRIGEMVLFGTSTVDRGLGN